jgi:FkbM family methyltransferase
MKLRAEALAKVAPLIGKPPGWERVVRKVVPPELCSSLTERWVHREGFRFKVNPAVPIGWNVLFFGTYEPELREVLRAVLKPGAVCIDVGANVGWHTLLMGHLVGSAGLVLAVEANPSVRLKLREHVDANGLSNVEIVGKALSDRCTLLQFVAPPAESCRAGDGHIVEQVPASEDVVSVEAVTLDWLCDHHGIARLDFVKMDVEGFEYAVLQGSVESIARFRPAVAFEFNSDYIVRGHAGAGDLPSLFARLNYKIYEFTRRGLQPLTNTALWPKCANLLAVPSEATSTLG